MRKLSIFLLLVTSAAAAWAQVARLADPDNFDPAKECKILVDLSKATDARAIGLGDDGEVYLWTWAPGSPADMGSWADINKAKMKMTSEGGTVWSYTLIPTEFYGVDAKAVYDNDFSLLARNGDGSKQTEDLKIEVAPPSYRIFSIPPRKAPTNDSTFSRSTEVMTVFYDNKLETNTAMQAVDTVIIFYRITLSNGQTIAPLSFNNSRNNAKLAMTSLGNGLFRMQLIPETFFRDPNIFDPAKIPAGTTITAVECQFVKKGTSTSAAAPNYKMVFSDCP